MPIPTHRNPAMASHLNALGNPLLSPLSNAALSPLSNPALSPISNPALSPISNPALSAISNPALSKISNPALSPISNPRLSPFQNSGASLSGFGELDGFYIFDTKNELEGYAVFAQDDLAIVKDVNDKELGLALHQEDDYWLFLPPGGGAPVEQWWVIEPQILVRFRNRRIVGLCT